MLRSQNAGYRQVGLLLLSFCAYGAEFDPKAYLEHVKYLASPELKGRATGSAELEKAEAYLESKYKSFGVKPAGKTYGQTFNVTLEPRLGKNNKFGTLVTGNDYVPLSFSSHGTFSAKVAFAGYGITAPEIGYDDYAGLDVAGKFVLILRHVPQEGKQSAALTVNSQHATLANKAVNAKLHGAKGVFLVNDAPAHNGTDEMTKFGKTAGPTDSGVAYVQVSAAVADGWLKANGSSLADAEGAIDKDGKPHSFALDKTSADLTIDIEHLTKSVHNVAAYIPGTTAEYVVVGAHYDHLGLGDENSLAPSQIGQVHPGADDNASGTAGVVELARWFAKQPKQKRGILFLDFAGEELGLLGSQYYVDHPILPIKNAVAMINMDMIGRIREGKVYLGGTGTGSTFGKLLEEVKKPASLQMDLSERTGYGASDHTSFTTKQVPTLFFFSGLHGDYHKPSDTWDKIDAPSAATLLGYVSEVVTKLASAPERPEFVRVAEPSRPASTSSSSSSGYGPAFGSIPDFNEPPKGVRFADVRDGTPAAKAGLKAGDILISFDGKDIGNLYDFTYALQAKKPGDVVLVRVLRGTETIEAKVLLTERR